MRNRTILQEVLLGLIPYTKQNSNLTLHPARFFADLEKTSGKKQKSIEAAYYRARSGGFVSVENGYPRLTQKATREIEGLSPSRLIGNVNLLVVFDIPEELRIRRNQFRTILKKNHFEQVQKSVWISQYDQEVFVRSKVMRLRIEKYVKFYQCASL